jgi:hypothetical protein
MALRSFGGPFFERENGEGSSGLKPPAPKLHIALSSLMIYNLRPYGTETVYLVK